ncbi:LysR family transcriptional regulator [Larsenimonas rhizosphaerae]|uniref:LysR family transcriptional regulator n=1 Tax=Larsenimonas rhizosphaerae TaxID=2944682 RepID=A0AA41ZLH7_9GAMM|nr:LysR family transcriptional regulator [Larsenimonas rhizosphaerae]MCM2130286.1 LysR family transcriptional regulator [Larsenimonas rhizosphaerae]MCX2522990.1 LysR family transcriptional regulator [Larsenimonas rhizosphaerae]
MSKITLSQWQMLAAVADHGGFARAADVIHKSPSTINHAVHKLEDQLGVKLLVVDGRQVRLSEAGGLLLRRARQLLEGAEALENVAGSLAEGLEPEISIAVDQIFPTDALSKALDGFSVRYPHTRIQLHETVLKGGVEMLQAGEVDLLISGVEPSGFLGELLVTVRFIAVAHSAHALHQLDRALDLRDLHQHRQIVVRDSARQNAMDSGWLKAEQRWTVSHVSTALDMLSRGLGFCWVSETRLNDDRSPADILPLPLKAGGIREVPVRLYYLDMDSAGPATRALAEELQKALAGCNDCQDSNENES